MFACLEFSSHSRIFYSFGDVTIASEGLHILTCSALTVIEQGGFFSVQNLLWHGASVDNGNIRGPVTRTPNAERLQWSCHYLCFCKKKKGGGMSRRVTLEYDDSTRYVSHKQKNFMVFYFIFLQACNWDRCSLKHKTFKPYCHFDEISS